MCAKNTDKKGEKGVKTNSEISSMTLEEKQRLVCVFAWLLQEDKKQNPELYQVKKDKSLVNKSYPLTTGLICKV